MKLPRVTGDKAVKILQRAGFSLVHVRGSHHYLHHPGHDCIVTVPVHPKKTLAPTMLTFVVDGRMLSRVKMPRGNSGTTEPIRGPVVPLFPRTPDFRGHNSKKRGTGLE